MSKFSMNRVSINIIYAFLLQISSFIFPLITTPYISEVLGPEKIGIVNFSQSVVGWFLLFATLGSMIYGVRGVAKKRDDFDELSKFVSELLLIKLITTVAVLIVYLAAIFTVEEFKTELLLYVLNGINILLSVFSLDWFYQGIEEFKYITVRSLFFKVVSIIALFMCVLSEDDYLKYAIISIFSMSFSNILNFVRLKKYVKISFKGCNLTQHIKPIMLFFSSNLATSMYTMFDQILLGFIRTSMEVAFYSRAKMFISVGLSFSTALINAITPSALNAVDKDKTKYEESLKFSVNLIYLIGIPTMCGIFILATEIIYLFGGEMFLPTVPGLVVLTPLLVITPLSVWNYNQRIVARGYEKISFKIFVVQAILSIVLNVLIVPYYGFIGTSIVWLIVEVIGLALGLYCAYKIDKLSILDSTLYKASISAVLMIVGIVFLKTLLSTTWLSMMIYIATGAGIYAVSLILLKEKVTISKLELIKKLF